MQDLTNPQSWNAYAYVNNNPLKNVDPDGKGISEIFEKIANKLRYGYWLSNQELGVEAAKASDQIKNEFAEGDSNGVQHPYDTSQMSNGQVILFRDQLVTLREQGKITTVDKIDPTGAPIEPSPALRGDPYHPDKVTERQNGDLKQLREKMQSPDRAAERVGFDRIAKDPPFDSHGQKVFTDGSGRFITRDIDSHSGGVWKMFNRSGQRLGTYDANLNRIGK